MQGISGGQGISPWSDLDVLTLDLVGQRLDIDQLLLPSCYQNTPYQEHPHLPSRPRRDEFSPLTGEHSHTARFHPSHIGLLDKD